jgi:hypothetical protein
MRRWGLLLLLGGFAGLLGLGFLSDCTDADIFANTYDSLTPRNSQPTFSQKEVQERIETFFNKLHYHHPGSVILPSLVMLTGGLMLYAGPRNAAKPPNI